MSTARSLPDARGRAADRLPAGLLLALALSALVAAAEDEPHAPGRFVHHPDIDVELWAREPLVVDPVALAFAADGSCFVVEMRDYPLGIDGRGTGGGTVRRLRDTDGDGAADESILFAEGLSFPTSVLPWGEGVLVCAPPEVIHLEDTDGDGRADRRLAILSGLARGVTDSNANSLRFGVDGRIHLANGGNGGRVRVAGSDAAPLDLAGADLAFAPAVGLLERTARTGGGFGLVFDDVGHSFTTYNLDHLQQRVVPAAQIERAADVVPFAGTASISDHGESALLHPVSVAATRPNHPEQAGRFSSSGGMGFLDGEPFSPRLAGSVLVCDVVTNLVHRDRLVDAGAVFAGTRSPEEAAREFLASPDPAFRPVAIEPGPDGALYLADMQRDVIEHPDYIPEGVRARLDLRAGADRGRIYRITPRGGLPSAGQPPPLADPERLVAELGHPFRWRRDTAHRLLVTAFPSAATSALLAEMRESASPVARLRAARILAATGRLGQDEAAAAAADPHPDVRETAVSLLAGTAAPPAPLLALLDDPHPRVRFAAALALDGVEAPGRGEALARFLCRDIDDPWARRAACLAADGDARILLAAVWTLGEAASPAGAVPDAIRGLAHALAVGEPAAATSCVELLAGPAGPAATAALLEGLRAGWKRSAASRPAPEAVAALLAAASLDGAESPALGLSADFSIPLGPRLRAAVERALGVVNSATTAESLDAKRSAIRLLGTVADGSGADALVALLAGSEPAEIQGAALETLVARRHPGLGGLLVAAWRGLDPSLRPAVVARIVGDRESRRPLLDAVRQGAIRLGELNLDLEQRRSLLRAADPEVARLAAELFSDDEYGDRSRIVAEWLARMPDRGDAAAGSTLFRKRCTGCHRLGSDGHRVGPDLDTLAHRSVEDIVTHVLDPNVAINPGYVACVVETDDGRTATGLLVSRGAEAVTIRRPEGIETTYPRSEIVDLRILATSLMPEGLEQGMSPADLRDLVAFLQDHAR